MSEDIPAHASPPKQNSGQSTAPSNGTAPSPAQEAAKLSASIKSHLKGRALVLVGLMGAGKTTIGRRLAQALDLDFVDADAEIETAAGETIPEIFENHGEAAFRAGEKRVIARLLTKGPHVLATGGGAYMNAQTRENIAQHAVSIWLHADLDVLMDRVGRRGNRPLLNEENPRAVMEKLISERYPIYELADLTVDSVEGTHEHVVEKLLIALNAYLTATPAKETSK
ncbi:MAG: shikimate kinase [Parvibaculaceae bacterium]|jgi:shikimate kinase